MHGYRWRVRYWKTEMNRLWYPPDLCALASLGYIYSPCSKQVYYTEGAAQVLSGRGSACQFRRCRFYPCVGSIPWRRKWQSTLVLLPGKSHGQRSLVGYSPWGRKESDVIEWLSMSLLICVTISPGLLATSWRNFHPFPHSLGDCRRKDMAACPAGLAGSSITIGLCCSTLLSYLPALCWLPFFFPILQDISTTRLSCCRI